MKELSIEEKARCYDEAIKKAEELYNQGLINPPLEHIFPELQESENERIRKSLINYFRCIAKNGDTVWTNLDYDKVIAWLEKQGEQKPADKIEPKFQKGQWIVFNGLTLYINAVVQGYYRTTSIGGIPNSYDWDIDKIARLWTIQDAKRRYVETYC